mgnify:CR=1 FL=1
MRRTAFAQPAVAAATAVAEHAVTAAAGPAVVEPAAIDSATAEPAVAVAAAEPAVAVAAAEPAVAVAAAAAAAKGTRRRGKRGKEAKRMAKVEDRAKEAESAPEETKPVCVAASTTTYGIHAPYTAPLDPATTCTPAPHPPPLTIHGTPILPFHLDPDVLGSTPRAD